MVIFFYWTFAFNCRSALRTDVGSRHKGVGCSYLELEDELEDVGF